MKQAIKSNKYDYYITTSMPFAYLYVTYDFWCFTFLNYPNLHRDNDTRDPTKNN